MGPYAGAAAPAMSKHLTDPAIGLPGTDGKRRPWEIDKRYEIYPRLIQIDPKTAEAAGERILEWLHSENPLLRDHAAGCFRWAGSNLAPTLRSAIACDLDDPSVDRQLTAGKILAGDPGPVGVAARTRLLEILGDENRTKAERLRASEPLSSLGPLTPSRLWSVLLGNLKSPDASIRIHAIQSLNKAPDELPIPPRALLRLVDDADPTVRLEFLRISHKRRLEGETFIEAFAKLAEDLNQNVSINALAELRSLGARAEPVVPRLVSLYERLRGYEPEAGQSRKTVEDVYEVLKSIDPATAGKLEPRKRNVEVKGTSQIHK